MATMTTPTYQSQNVSASDLWPDDGHDHAVHVDLFEPYLEPT